MTDQKKQAPAGKRKPEDLTDDKLAQVSGGINPQPLPPGRHMPQ